MAKVTWMWTMKLLNDLAILELISCPAIAIVEHMGIMRLDIQHTLDTSLDKQKNMYLRYFTSTSSWFCQEWPYIKLTYSSKLCIYKFIRIHQCNWWFKFSDMIRVSLGVSAHFVCWLHVKYNYIYIFSFGHIIQTYRKKFYLFWSG